MIIAEGGKQPANEINRQLQTTYASFAAEFLYATDVIAGPARMFALPPGDVLAPAGLWEGGASSCRDRQRVPAHAPVRWSAGRQFATRIAPKLEAICGRVPHAAAAPVA